METPTSLWCILGNSTQLLLFMRFLGCGVIELEVCGVGYVLFKVLSNAVIGYRFVELWGYWIMGLGINNLGFLRLWQNPDVMELFRF